MGMPAHSVIIELVSDRSRLVRELAALLRQSLRIGPNVPALTADEPIFVGRLGLDSVDALQWAAAVERQYDCELEASDFAAGALESLGQMADTLMSRGITPTNVERDPSEPLADP